MRLNRGGLWIVLAMSAFASSPALAADKPFNLSLFPPVALVQPEDNVTVLRLNLLYGKNASVNGVDLGFVNHTTTLSNGLQWGFVNVNEGDSKGLQLSAISYTKGTAEGLQWSTFNYAGTARGLQLAILNYAESLQGVQIGLLNIAKTGGTFPAMVIANWKK